MGSFTPRLTYKFCDDWFIYAEDDQGRLWTVCTELWPEWIDLPPGTDQEENAVERYMLPVARRHWARLNWSRIPDDELADWRELVLEDLVDVLRALQHVKRASA